MKKRNLLILMISAFFVLTGCGIPNIFTIGSSISVPSGNITNNSITAQYRVTQSHPEELTKINPAHGPKIFLGYVITGEKDTFSGVSASTIQAAFEKKAGTMPTKGRHFNSLAYREGEGILTLKVNDLDYVVYPFSDRNGTEFTSFRNYHIAYKGLNHISSANMLATDFMLTFSKDFSLNLINDHGNYTAQFTGNLYRFKGTSFETINTNQADVKATDLHEAWIHIFAAVNISEGYFTNIYWSPISYLGSIKIKE